MDSVVAKCAFCPRRHVIELESIDTWFVQCDCGACGFIEDDRELMESGHGGPGFTVRESSTMDGRPILLSDPLAVFVDEWARRWHVSWYLLVSRNPDDSPGE